MLQERLQDEREHFTNHFTGQATDHSNGVQEITPSGSPDQIFETKLLNPIQTTIKSLGPEPWLWSPKIEAPVVTACVCSSPTTDEPVPKTVELAQSLMPTPISTPIDEALPVSITTPEPTIEVEAPPAPATVHLPASTRLRNMISSSEKIIVCPGVYDGLSARIAISVGFDAMYMTGAGTTASRLGMADLGIAQLHDMRTNAEMIANLVPDGPPLIADMDTGYGGPLVIAKAVQQYILAGVAGFHIEDQVLQKRCGHLAGKEVVSADEYLKRIQAAKGAAMRLRSDIVIIARTDALQSRGYDECIARLKLARDAGADMGILEGCTTKEQAAQAVRDLAGWPLCLNSVENGVSPVITADEAQKMGYRVMVFSFAGVFPAYTAIKATFEWLKAEGVTGTSSDVTPKTIFRVCGLSESMEIDKEAGGSAFANGV